MSGLFSTFNIAKRGMNVQQKSIEVTSHNISNVNTPGYSRQRAVIKATAPNVGMINAQVGTGAQVENVERIRDTFLDYQVRQELSSLGKYENRSNILSQVESIFNELTSNGISSKMDKFFNSFQELSKTANSSFARAMVIEESSNLCAALNDASNKLDSIEKNSNELIKNNLNITNSIISQIDTLNKEIISSSSSGLSPNDLMDQRDALIDELSKKMTISVKNENFNGITVSLVTGSEVVKVVSDDYNSKNPLLAYISDITKDSSDPSGATHIISYKVDNGEKGSSIKTIRVSNLSDSDIESLSKNRILMADADGNALRIDGTPISSGEKVESLNLHKIFPSSGEISGIAAAKDEIEKCRQELDKVAKVLALSVNAIHSGIVDPLEGNGVLKKDYTPFFVNSDVALYGSNSDLINLTDTLLGESSISAKNISINKELVENAFKIKAKTNDHLYENGLINTEDGDGDGLRALAIADLKDRLMNIDRINSTVFSRADLFNQNLGGLVLEENGLKISGSNNGLSISGFYGNLSNSIGIKIQESNNMIQSQEDLVNSLETSRLSVSGVSLDEEMANLVQFSQAYNANAKVLSTVNDLLDIVINGLMR